MYSVDITGLLQSNYFLVLLCCCVQESLCAVEEVMNGVCASVYRPVDCVLKALFTSPCELVSRSANIHPYPSFINIIICVNLFYFYLFIYLLLFSHCLFATTFLVWHRLFLWCCRESVAGCRKRTYTHTHTRSTHPQEGRIVGLPLLLQDHTRIQEGRIASLPLLPGFEVTTP